MRKICKITTPVSTLAAIALVGMSIISPRAHGQEFDPAKVEKGLDIAPVPLTYPASQRNLVGYGSYLVNAVADCNGCHSPIYPYVPGGNPYFGQPKQVDPTTYLMGQQDFGQVAVDVNGNLIGPHIISRNLTPDYTRRPEGGNTFAQFLQLIRRGTDLDHLHPPCATSPKNANCLLAVPGNEVDGNLLQVMPWPAFTNMSDDDLLAIYTYLGAIPCNPGPATPADLPPEQQYMFKALHNNCTAPK
jgi:hypothetical protein